MVTPLTQEFIKLVLPFSALASNRVDFFSDEAEKAAIFCLAEMERGKGSGIVAKQSPEKIDFIAKIHYPFWLLPFHETSLVFDGLKTISHAISYPAIRDTQAFIDAVARSSNSRQAYSVFLSDSASHFQPANKDETKVFEGLIVDAAFQEDFGAYLSSAKLSTFSSSHVAAILPTIDERFILSSYRELEGLYMRFVTEINDLNKSIKLLNAVTGGFVQIIREETEEARSRFEEELEKRKGPVEEQSKALRLKCDTEITVISKSYGKELLQLQKEKIKQEKTRDRLLRRIAHAEVQMKNAARRKDDVGKRKWNEERKKCKKECSNAESEIKKLEKQLKETEDRKSSELFRIKSECDARTQEAAKELVDIESSRDAKVQILNQEKDKIEGLTETIIKQIDVAAKLRETSITAFEKYGIPRKYDQITLVHLPFYLVRFQSDARKRYVYYPPSNINDVKFSTKLLGVLGMARVKQLFTPRSDTIVTLLNKVPLMLEENAALGRQVCEDAVKSNILGTEETMQSIKAGLVKLKEEGWLSEKEYESFDHELI